MPAGMVRPRASQAPRLGAGAILDYRERGWTITPFGRVSSGIVTGPCARCRAVCVRYGPNGRPVCTACLEGDAPYGLLLATEEHLSKKENP